MPQEYDASKEFKGKKVVLVSVPGKSNFLNTRTERHKKERMKEREREEIERKNKVLLSIQLQFPYLKFVQKAPSHPHARRTTSHRSSSKQPSFARRALISLP